MPVSPILFIGVWLLICLAAFAVGLRFYRMTEPKGGVTVEQARRFGRLMMMAASALVLFVIAAFVHGDLNVIKTAKVFQ